MFSLHKKPISNLKIWNLCSPSTTLPSSLEKTLGLGLGFCINFNQNKHPQQQQRQTQKWIDFDRLRSAIRKEYADFSNNNDTFNPKLYVRKKSNSLAPALLQIEWTIDKFEKDCNTAFRKSHKRAFKANLAREDIAMLKQVRRDRKFIIVNTDKNLGPSIMEIDLYIRRA